MLLNVLNQLVERGNTVLVIEHNMDVIKVADHVIDLGPSSWFRLSTTNSLRVLNFRVKILKFQGQ